MVKAWTVRRGPEAETWDAELVASMKGSPQRMSEEEPGASDDRTVSVELEAPDEEEHDELPRCRVGERKAIYLKKADFMK